MDKIISKTKYNRKDHKNYYRFHMIHRSRSLYFFLIIMIVFIIWTTYNTFTLDNVEKISNLILSWAITAFTILIVPLMMILQINNIVKKESRERKESIDIITVTKDKIEKNISNIKGKVIIGWKQVEAIYENKEYIYIYTGPQQGMFIKKSDIIEGDIMMFRKIARANLKKNKRGKVKYKIVYREGKDER